MSKKKKVLLAIIAVVVLLAVIIFATEGGREAVREGYEDGLESEEQN